MLVGLTVTLPLPEDAPTVIVTFTVWVPTEAKSITPVQVLPVAIPFGFTVTRIGVTVEVAVYGPSATFSQMLPVQLVS
jgi:hypothetical protein